MAVVLGISAGFVTEAPVADPAGSNIAMDNNNRGTRHTTPAGATKVTEIDWWCDTASEEGNYEVAIYEDVAGSPGAIVGSALINAKGTGFGWKRATGLNIPVDAETAYWIVVALVNVTTSTSTNYSADAGESYCFDNSPILIDPWEGSDASNFIYAVCAVWEAAAGNAGIMTTNTGYWGPTF